MLDAIVWLFASLGSAFTDFFAALTQPALWLSWTGGLETTEDKQALMRFVYYGGSKEFFFVVFTAFILLTVAGLWRRAIMWRSVRVLEGLANGIGRFFAWAGLLMVLQQIVIVFMQRIFTAAQISFGFGSTFSETSVRTPSVPQDPAISLTRS